MYCLITEDLSILVLGKKKFDSMYLDLSYKWWIVYFCLMYSGCCIYVLLLLNMPEMAHDWINKSILFNSILFYSILCVVTAKASQCHLSR